MSFLFGGGSTPRLPQVVAPVDESAIKLAAFAEAERLRKRKGMKSTILTDVSNSSSLLAPEAKQGAEMGG